LGSEAEVPFFLRREKNGSAERSFVGFASSG
jgi:hypothetical protein